MNVAGSPVGLYDFLLPSAAEDILRKAFVGYKPTVDAALLVLVAAIGIISLFVQRWEWASEHGGRVLVPVVLAVGVAIAVAVPLVLLAIYAQSQSDSS